ncbi:MAG: acyl-CoA thioesterase [Methylococcales symbiont of Hymedesmia sp. n. MRB-2018]|nr:MAG: acyl-CoA thioesterase [Methylococcales symbiont of Hymedesmia sp. n. MRB-2018]KAF3984210.1 MAG: acyl-CoA thioesterase [Methylococcales symbiont of Hymedesmia sp. n. MRB-2018]
MSNPLVDCEVEFEVPFFDIDLMEVVWHGHYVKYFELARCALLEKISYNYMQMRESGYSWPVIDLHLRYAHPAKFGQKIIIYAQIVEWQNCLTIKYKITDKLTGKRLTRGKSIQVAVNLSTQTMCFESPNIIWQKLGIEKNAEF